MPFRMPQKKSKMNPPRILFSVREPTTLPPCTYTILPSPVRYAWRNRVATECQLCGSDYYCECESRRDPNRTGNTCRHEQD